MAKDSNCCIFHNLGGPAAMACDNYGREGREPKDASTVDPNAEQAILFGDIIDWDAYGNPAAELASDSFDAVDVPDIVDFG